MVHKKVSIADANGANSESNLKTILKPLFTGSEKLPRVEFMESIFWRLGTFTSLEQK